MSKRTWTNIGLLTAIILLSVYISLSDKKTPDQLPRLSEIDRDSISNIEVIRKDLDNFTFKKEGDGWFMQSPLPIKANMSRINAMTRMLNVESFSNLEPGNVELSRFELDDPKIILKLDDYEFKFGNTDAIDQRRYVLFNNKIHLVNDSLYQQLTTNAAFFADTKLFDPGTEITAIEFPDNKLEKINNNWQLQTPLDIKPDQLPGIALVWQDAMAISVSRYEPPENETLITITKKDNGQITFVIVKTEPHLVLGRKDLNIQYHMGSDDGNRMLLNTTRPEEKNNELPLQVIE